MKIYKVTTKGTQKDTEKYYRSIKTARNSLDANLAIIFQSETLEQYKDTMTTGRSNQVENRQMTAKIMMIDI